MKIIRIPLYRTFTNWIIIVVIGSVFLPFIGNLLFSGISEFRRVRFDEEMLSIMVISMACSALCSIPALIIMFVAHLILNKKEFPFKEHRFYQNLVHLGVSVLTFGVMLMIVGTGKKELNFVGALAVTYPLVGLVVWNITYMIYKNKQSIVAENQELLDEL
jgi:ABC-type sulfate transport system permease component